MVNQTADYFENLAKGLGLSIKIPRPSPAAKSMCSAVNAFMGVALMGTGAVLKKPWIVLLGTLGVAGAALLKIDK